MFPKEDIIELSSVSRSITQYIPQGQTTTLLFITLFAFLLYGQTLKYSYSDLDDTILLQEDSIFINDLSNIGKAFTQTVFNMRPDADDIYYRPVLVASFILDSQLGRNPAFVYHFSNILFHCLAAFLLFQLFLRLKYDRTLSFVATLFFLAHPSFTTAVAWIPGRNDSLLAVFILGSFITLIDHLRSPSALNLLLNLLCATLALFTKETAIILFLLFFIYMYIEKDKGNSHPLLKPGKVILLSGWLLCILLYYAIRGVALSGKPGTGLAELARLFSEHSPTLIQYMGKLIFPFNLSTYPKMEDTSFLFGLLACAGCIYLFSRKPVLRMPHFITGLAWFVLFLLPAGIIAENALEHRLYVPSIGFFIMCMNTKTIGSLDLKKGVVRWIAGFLLILFCVLTFSHSKNFKDAHTFWSKAVETSPSSATAHFHMGIYYQLRNDPSNAEKEYLTALQGPAIRHLHNNLGKIYLDKGMLREAEEHFRLELQIQPDEVAYYNLFSIREKQGNLEEGKKYLLKALELKPNYEDALNDLGSIYAMEQKYDEALTLFRKATDARPTYTLAHKNIALVYLAKKEYKKAKEYYDSVRQKGIEIRIPMLDTLQAQ